MDFDFTSEERMLQETVRDFFKKERLLEQVCEIERVGIKAFLPVYRNTGGLGFLGIQMPEQYGGTSESWVDGLTFNEEVGRALVPTVHRGMMGR